ncbi:efflux RND transporter periplasmic adaptor subunit [Chryseobacterium cucumeris]|uniref:efflux RND transporter periplasmic adaptor subunit n=1 Tax=Chryseobacterium TaxID=59732 RepID=UPI0028835122|nr:efflux RND transporter periplasmic adaptor subunit [Chryseobacterium sp. SG20098]WNI36433.1 efflux RND transporter periplasmic adaptor subunit [Chryseobacterium sp. SG20098]
MNKLYKYLIPAILIFSLQSCTNEEKKEVKKIIETASPETETVHPKQEDFASSTVIPGELQPYQKVDVYAKVSSFVKKLYVDVGNEVKVGQLLATLEAPEISSQQSAAASTLKSKEALYIASKAKYDRLKETSKTPGTISALDLEQALATQKSDLAQLEAAKASYREVADVKNYLQIRAPFSGNIATRNVSAGAYVGPSGKGSDLPMFNLVQQNKLRLVVNVPESYTGLLNKNSDIKFSIQSIPGETFTAKISRFATALDNKLRSQWVEMDVYNKDKRLLPGMVANVILPLSANSKSLSVPTSAVLNSTLGVFVIKVEKNTVHWVPVTIGIANGETTTIIGHISPNDVIVKNASEEIRDGEHIRVKLQR